MLGNKRKSEAGETKELDNVPAPPRKKPHSDGGAAHKFFATATLHDVVRERKWREIIELEHHQTVAEGLETLAEHKISSAPVVLAASAEDDESGTYLGLLDFHGILHKLIQAMQDQPWETLPKVAEEYGNRKLITVCGDKDISVMFKAEDTTPLHEVLAHVFLHKDGSHVHRVALFDGAGRVKGFITQSDIIRFFLHHKDRLSELLKETVEQLKLGTADPVCVQSDMRTIEAFKLMDRKAHSSVAVVDADGKLVANLSAADVRGSTLKHVHKLLEPLSKYLDLAHKKASPQTCKMSHTLQEVMEQCAEHRVHQLYVVDHHGKPSRIITLTDIIRLVADM